MSGNIIYTVPWVGGTGNIGYPFILKTGEKPDFIITPAKISDNYYGISTGYDYLGIIGDINPPTEQWMPSGTVALMSARLMGDKYYLFFVGNKMWNSYSQITIRAVAEDGEFTTNVRYNHEYDRYEKVSNADDGWYGFIKGNVGNDIEVYITEYQAA